MCLVSIQRKLNFLHIVINLDGFQDHLHQNFEAKGYCFYIFCQKMTLKEIFFNIKNHPRYLIITFQEFAHI